MRHLTEQKVRSLWNDLGVLGLTWWLFRNCRNPKRRFQITPRLIADILNKHGLKKPKELKIRKKRYMDIRNGDIYPNKEAALKKINAEFARPMIIPPTLRQLKNGKVGRNDPCPCGSGKKFKKCCLVKG